MCHAAFHASSSIRNPYMKLLHYLKSMFVFPTYPDLLCTKGKPASDTSCWRLGTSHDWWRATRQEHAAFFNGEKKTSVDQQLWPLKYIIKKYFWNNFMFILYLFMNLLMLHVCWTWFYPSTVLRSREGSETIPKLLTSLEIQFLRLLAAVVIFSNCGTNVPWTNSCN